ncbi:MAG: DUF3047 domain-containing protein [Myxococcota bacterium]
MTASLDGKSLAERWEALRARVPSEVRARSLAAAHLIRLPANVPPWTDTGMRFAKGDEVTILAEGRAIVSSEMGLSSRPRYALWSRLGRRGPVWTGTRDTQSFRCDRDGALELAIYNGEWKSPDGVLATPVEAYEGLTGEVQALVLHWRGEARDGLTGLQRVAPGEPLVEAELARMANPAVRPAGWNYLWFLGQSETFRTLRPRDGRPSIGCQTEDDVAILRRSVSLPLGPDTEVSWRWRVTALPSSRPEDALLCHDYLSVAVEFDNGRDLSWFWSAGLPVETHFACPIPQWNPRETHLVVRSGGEGLGVWQSERRNVYADYARAIGAPPGRIVAVWLIAVSLFQHGRGEAEFAEIALTSAGERAELVGK